MDTPSFRDPDSNGAPQIRAPQVDQLLSGSAPNVLARLCDGDPLELELRCTNAVRRRALLVSIDRLTTKCMARIAFSARRRPAKGDFETWLSAEIDQAIDDLLDEDAEEDLGGSSVVREDERYTFLSASLGVETIVARRMCVVFHALPLEHRRVFHALVLDRKSIDEAAQSLAMERARVETLLRITLQQLSSLGHAPRPSRAGEFDDDE